MASDCGDVYPNGWERECLRESSNAYKEGNYKKAAELFIKSKLDGLSTHYGVQAVGEAELPSILSSKRIGVGQKCICSIGSTYEGYENLRCSKVTKPVDRSTTRTIHLFQVGKDCANHTYFAFEIVDDGL